VRMCTLEIVRATEMAALAAGRFTGRGDEMGAELAALEAMDEQLRKMPVCGKIIIGEEPYSESGRLEVGGLVGGDGQEHEVDLAVMPLEGCSINARALTNALSVIAIAEKDCLLQLPSMYMDKIAIGPGYERDVVSLERSPKQNIENLAAAKGVAPEDITVCILDRTRHRELVASVREAGAAIRLFGDGDIAGVIQTSDPAETGIDMYLGVGGSNQGVLAAAALCCVGGQMQGRLVSSTDEDRKLLRKFNISDPAHIYSLEEMITGDVTFAATGVTDGHLLDGVHRGNHSVSTQSMVMRASARTVRTIDAVHQLPLKTA